MSQTIQKQLIGHEDLLIGSGVATQQRGQSSVNVRRLELTFILRTKTEIRDLDTSLYTRVALHQSGAVQEYWFDATSNATDNDDRF